MLCCGVVSVSCDMLGQVCVKFGGICNLPVMMVFIWEKHMVAVGGDMEETIVGADKFVKSI